MNDQSVRVHALVRSHQDSAFQLPPEDGIDYLPAKPGVYLILNRVNGKRYLGQSTKNIRHRCLLHRNELRNGTASNVMMRRDCELLGVDAFFFTALRTDAIHDTGRSSHWDKVEIWFAVQFGIEDERRCYNQEAGHRRTMPARFRDRERKLLRRSSQKYELLPGVDLYDPINPVLLAGWVPGN